MSFLLEIHTQAHTMLSIISPSTKTRKCFNYKVNECVKENEGGFLYVREHQEFYLSDFELFMHNLWWECGTHKVHITLTGILNNKISHFNGNPADIFPPPSWWMLGRICVCVFISLFPWKYAKNRHLTMCILKWLIVFVTFQGGDVSPLVNCFLICQNNENVNGVNFGEDWREHFNYL